MKTIVYGDSHTGAFNNKALTFSPGPITMRNFYSFENDYRKSIDEFHKQNAEIGDNVVLCLGEIDVRAHFWRDFPVFFSRGMTLDSFINTQAEKFIESCKDFYHNKKLGRIIIWGAPAASVDGRKYNHNFPFVGSSITRNILTHKLNIALMRKIITASHAVNIKFASLFYNMISPAFTTETSYLYDGVHLDPKFSDTYWNILEQTNLGSASIVVDNFFHEIQDIDYAIKLQKNTYFDKPIGFDAWIKLNKSEINLDIKRTIEVDISGSTSNFGFYDAINIMKIPQPIVQLELSSI